jgi:hypothetical protein
MAYGQMLNAADPFAALIIAILQVVVIAAAIEVLLVYDRPFTGELAATPAPLIAALQH